MIVFVNIILLDVYIFLTTYNPFCLLNTKNKYFYILTTEPSSLIDSAQLGRLAKSSTGFSVGTKIQL